MEAEAGIAPAGSDVLTPPTTGTGRLGRSSTDSLGQGTISLERFLTSEGSAALSSALLDMAFSWFTSPARYHEAAKVIFARLVAQNVKYVETSFASGVIEFGGLNGREVLAAIRTAVRAATANPFHGRLIAGKCQGNAPRRWPRFRHRRNNRSACPRMTHHSAPRIAETIAQLLDLIRIVGLALLEGHTPLQEHHVDALGAGEADRAHLRLRAGIEDIGDVNFLGGVIGHDLAYERGMGYSSVQGDTRCGTG